VRNQGEGGPVIFLVMRKCRGDRQMFMRSILFAPRLTCARTFAGSGYNSILPYGVAARVFAATRYTRGSPRNVHEHGARSERFRLRGLIMYSI